VGFVFSPRRIHHAASFVTHKNVPSHFPGIAANSWTRSGSLKFQLKNPNIPSNLWLLMSGDQYQGQCIQLAQLMEYATEIIGVPASTGFVYGSTDTTCYSISSVAQETHSCANHGQEILLVWSARGWNNWEAVCNVDGVCYAVKLSSGTAIEILRNWLGANTTSGNYQAWVYYDHDTDSYKSCVVPGPCPVQKP